MTRALSPQAVERLIGDAFESLSPELKRAARWLQQHQTALALHSMRSSAREAGVSPATMTRLAQRLGFKGFEEMRKPFVVFVGQVAAGRAQSASSLGNGGADAARRAGLDVATQLNALQQNNIASVLTLNSPESLQAAADATLQARTVYFLGMRACHGVAFHLHYVYGLLAANGVLISDVGGTLADQITRLDRDDVLMAISQSPYTRQTVDAVALAHEQHATVIALTDAALSPIARRASHVLLFETATSSFFQSIAGAESVAECLIATVAARGGAPTQTRLRRMQEHLRRTRAYWERPARATRAARPEVHP